MGEKSTSWLVEQSCMCLHLLLQKMWIKQMQYLFDFETHLSSIKNSILKTCHLAHKGSNTMFSLPTHNQVTENWYARYMYDLHSFINNILFLHNQQTITVFLVNYWFMNECHLILETMVCLNNINTDTPIKGPIIMLVDVLYLHTH